MIDGTITQSYMIYDLQDWPWQRRIKNIKQGVHPDYQQATLIDSAAGARFLVDSALSPSETIELEGKTYPLVRVETSSGSHPFYTGKQKFVQAGGRIEKFNKKHGLSSKESK